MPVVVVTGSMMKKTDDNASDATDGGEYKNDGDAMVTG